MSIRKLFKKYIKYIRYDPKKYWNKHGGENYINKFSPSGEQNEEIIKQYIEEINPSSIVDIRCGYGRYLKYLRYHFPKIKLVGVEISHTQIEQAKLYLESSNDIELYETDGKTLPFDDRVFDISFTYGCLSAIPYNKIQNYFKEIKRITKYQGIFLECNQPDKSNIINSKEYWFYHNYHSLFNGSIIEEKKINEKNGDTIFLVHLGKNNL